MKSPAQRIIEEATDRLATLGNYRVASLAVDTLIRLEAISRRAWEAYPHLVRTVSGIAARDEVETLSERIAAMDDRVRQLEMGAEGGGE